jgi:hypothetical protein
MVRVGRKCRLHAGLAIAVATIENLPPNMTLACAHALASGGTMVSLIQSRPTVTRHGIGVARHYRRPPIGWRSRYLWSATATAAGFCRWLDSKRACSMSAEISAWRTWIVTHKSPRRRRSRYQRILRAPAETTGTLSEEMVMAVFRCRAGRTRRRPPPGRRHG